MATVKRQSARQAEIQSAARWIKRDNRFGSKPVQQRSETPTILSIGIGKGSFDFIQITGCCSDRLPAMSEESHNHAYIEHVRQLEQRLGPGDQALHLAVGGEFDAVGKLEYYLLRSLGLTDGHLIVDVGCGSGRLARQLASDKGIRYIGTDVVPRLIESAKELTKRDDWEFTVVCDGCIPCPDNAADFVTFFSVLTHTTHEESFKYFHEAARCLKVGGLVVVSFLEFRIQCHWETFIASVKAKPGGPLIQFFDRDAVAAWASHSGLAVDSFFDGDKAHIPIPEEIRWENGNCMKSLGNLGQSIAVLRKV
jgi:SAM-dependent methyltransferase